MDEVGSRWICASRECVINHKYNEKDLKIYDKNDVSYLKRYSIWELILLWFVDVWRIFHFMVSYYRNVGILIEDSWIGKGEEGRDDVWILFSKKGVFSLK